jgi:ELWxxDGT repeat protein
VSSLGIAASPPPIGSDPIWLGKMGGFLYFIAQPLPSTTAGGAALFKTDGTTAGTTQVASIEGFGIFPYLMATPFLSAGTKAYFLAYTTAAGQEVWVTDGTAAGTHQVADIYTGLDGDSPTLLGLIGTDLIFAEESSDNTLQLFRTDGTAAGTRTLSNFAFSQYGTVSESVAVDGKVYMALSDALTSGRTDLWVTDGTASGTVQIDSNEGPGWNLQPSSLRAFGNSLALLTDAENSGNGLSMVDTATNALTLLGPSSAPEVVYGSTIAGMSDFVLHLRGDLQLWRSDGTLAGSTMVKDIGPESPTSGMTRVGARAIFQSQNAQKGLELWGSDGTAQGTALLIATAEPSTYFQPLIGVAGSHGYYAVDTGTDYRIAVTDGTVAGTHILTDAGPIAINGITDTHVAGDDNLTFIYTYCCDDGSSATERLYAFRPQTNALTHLHDSAPLVADKPLLADAGRLYFTATDPVHADQPWVSDGTVAGTHILADLTNASPISASPTSLSLDPTAVGSTSAPYAVTLTNDGSSLVTFSAITLSGAQGNNFVLSNTCGSTLASGANCTLLVTFKPLTAGAKSASISIADNASGSPQLVALAGIGTASTPAPVVTLSTAALAFANQPLNTHSASQSITLTNSGTAELMLTSITLTGTQAHDFALSRGCGTQLDVGASCAVSVDFTPILTGPKASTVSIVDNAARSPHVITLSGTGTPAVPAVTLSTAAVTFDDQPVNTYSAAKTITLANTGTVPLQLTSIALTGSQAHDFALSKTCVSSLAAGANCAISVAFTPILTGPKTSTVSIVDSATGSPHVVALSDTGTPSIGNPVVALSTTALTFADQPIHTSSAAKAITLTNSGKAPLALTSIVLTGNQAHDFALSKTCGPSLAVGAGCTVSVAFAPVLAGPKTSTVSIVDNATGSPQVIALSGTGIAAVPAVTLSATTLAFANQVVNTSSAAKSITLTNSGTAMLSFKSITLIGNQAHDFALSNTCGGGLAAGASCTISAAFTPILTGAKIATVSIADTASGSPQTIALAGTGT